MRRHYFLVLSALLCLGLGLLLSCSSSSGGGSSRGGDDAFGDDDYVTVDDDAADGDDAYDDDSGDDDVGDDATDDDAGGDLIDNGDGTATDPSSGLTWQDPPYAAYFTWEKAKTYCQNLSLAGDGWHLPTISELRTLIRGCDGTITGGACDATDDCTEYDCENDPCHGCGFEEGPGKGGAYWPSGISGYAYFYWSSLLVVDENDFAWSVDFRTGRVGCGTRLDEILQIRCVRP